MSVVRMSQLLLRTLREDPADADTAGHALLLRGGYVRRVSSGVYTFLPLGLRVLQRLQRIIREELDAAGMQEILMPALSPIELWEQSGRAAVFGSDALPAMVVDARGGRFVLGLTHEEVVTTTVAAEVDSYRQLPLTVYQIQSKFRDEARPRHGLLRGREFLMCDAYSFDVDKEGMGESYRRALEAYLRIFERVSLPATPVEALSGAIGGDVNHEFMVDSPIGEDHYARCESCGYSANIERAEVGARPLEPTPAAGVLPGIARVATPGATTIDDVVAMLADASITAAMTIKSIAVRDEADELAVVLVPGDREVKLPGGWTLLDDAGFAQHPELVRGFIGPVGLSVKVLADASVTAAGHAWVTGANERDAHLTGVVFGRDFDVAGVGDFVVARDGDPCPRCGGRLELVRAVEAAHIFQLGLKYSLVMPGAEFTDEAGEVRPYWMGCYGMGVSRLVAVLAETFRDDDGLCWPAATAPFDVHLCALGYARSPEVAAAADALAAELRGLGLDVLVDDREVSAGVALADADLLGVPWRVTVGTRGLARSAFEARARSTGEVHELALDGGAAQLLALLRGA